MYLRSDLLHVVNSGWELLFHQGELPMLHWFNDGL